MKEARRYRLKLRYDGTDYCGWQRQKNGIAIQEVLENMLARLLHQPIKLIGSGRTDAGVHALGQVAHFDAATRLAPGEILRGLNALSPPGIQTLSLAMAPPDFHARFDAKWKTYRYQLLQLRKPGPFEYRYVSYVPHRLDLQTMLRAAALTQGEHDFRAFRKSGANPGRNTVRIIREFRVMQRGNFFRFELTGNGFLYNMVRSLCGSMVEIGRAKCSLSWYRALLDGTKHVPAGPTLPARGLFLVNVSYV